LNKDIKSSLLLIHLGLLQGLSIEERLSQVGGSTKNQKALSKFIQVKLVQICETMCNILSNNDLPVVQFVNILQATFEPIYFHQKNTKSKL